MIQRPIRPLVPIAREATKSIRKGRPGAVARYGPAFVILLAVAVLATGTGPGLEAAEAAETTEAGKKYPLISDKFYFTLGSYLTDFTTEASVGSDGVLGTHIRAEDDLGLDDDDTLFRVDGYYRFNERHSLDFGYWTFNRDGEAILNELIDFDGTTFSGTVRSAFDTSWFRLGWRYSFLRNERGEAGFSAGLSTYEFDIAIEGDATIDGGMTAFFDSASDSLIAPVPTFGIFINYAITPRMVIKLKADFLDLQVDDIDGKVIDTTFLFEWYFSRHVGLGVGANGTDISIRDRGEDPFTVDYSISGLMAYFSFSFGNDN